ncbi:signal peptidase I [Gordonia sp. (in: high G+C Gram-positive bacteria)]|uniref:signal peptidase I n=1 Tax=Gordonia sp. (in: high G+C Gram-positive bacteria) TaxID=84139 RepID=UPI003C793A45
MISSRGTHHTDETQVLPGPGEATTVAADVDDEKTPPIWWIKTIASYTLLAVAVALLAVLVVIPRLTGSTAYTVLTGSMQPTYPPGTLIVVKPTPGENLAAGDVITFQPKSGDPSVVTHRIVSIVYDAKGVQKFITKGDANNVTDETQLVAEQIRGRLIYSVPYLGRLNSVLSGSTRSVLLFLAAGALGVYALWMWISSLRDRKNGTGSGDQPDSDDEPDGDPSPPTVDPMMEAIQNLAVPEQFVPAQPTCHACGTPQVGSSQLAYSAVPELPRQYQSPPVHDGPSQVTTRPIPVVR